MKKVLLVQIILVLIISIVGCSKDPNYQPQEQSRLYWKNIDVKIVSIDIDQWFAGTHHYNGEIVVYSEEYQLTKTLSEYETGIFVPKWYEWKDGDIVTVKLYTKKIDSTGEIVSRQIKLE